MNFSALFQVTLVFLIVLDPLGNVPIFVSYLKAFDPSAQRRIILREMFVALGVMLLFLFFGQAFFKFLHIDSSALEIAGGVILFVIALKMVFSSPENGKKHEKKTEPFIVPLAIPSVAGPGILAMITLYSTGLEGGKIITLLAIFLSWLISLPCLLLASNLKKILGTNGLIAMERLFSYLIVLISVQMVIDGVLLMMKNTS